MYGNETNRHEGGKYRDIVEEALKPISSQNCQVARIYYTTKLYIDRRSYNIAQKLLIIAIKLSFAFSLYRIIYIRPLVVSLSFYSVCPLACICTFNFNFFLLNKFIILNGTRQYTLVEWLNVFTARIDRTCARNDYIEFSFGVYDF